MNRRRARSADHAALGALLRDARVAAGLTTREMGFSSGHISNVEGGYTNTSRDLLARYVAIGADSIAVEAHATRIEQQSRARRRANGNGPKALVAAPAALTAATRPADIRNHYRVVRYDVTFHFDGTGALQKVRSDVGIRANSRSVLLYFTGHSPDESHRDRPDPLLTPLRGAAVEEIRTSPFGAMDIFLRLDRAIEPDDPEPHTLSYEIEYFDPELADPAIHYLAPPSANQHRIECTFEAPMLPTAVWSVAAPDSYRADHPEPDASMAISPAGRYQQSFDNLVPGWIYGLTWTWPNSP